MNKNKPFRSLGISLLALACVTSFLGCAATRPEGGYSNSPADPWEPANRAIFAINNRIDRATLKPLAKGYKKITPKVVRTGISNFMGNLGYPVVFINDFLQGKFRQGGKDTLRFVLNSTVGLAGIVDVASEAGLKENNEDFGQTLAHWGVPSGPYVMLPFFGPSSLRDAPALGVDYLMDGRNYVGDSSEQDKLLIVDIIDLRTRLLSAEGILEDSYDPYLTLREAWLQRRQYLIHDGDPPLDEDFFDDEEFFDESN